MPKHAMHRINYAVLQKKIKGTKKSNKQTKQNKKEKNQPKNQPKNKNTPQDKKFFVNQILFVNSAK